MATLFKALVGCVALAAMPAWAQGDHAAPAWQGVWLGTVGPAPVHVCLEAGPDGKGAYYYDRVKRLLRLVPGKAGGEWFEQEQYDKNGARWRIAASGAALTGTWGDGKKELPVRLTRVAVVPGDESGPCGSLAFNRPRVGQVRLTSRQATEDGEPYTLLTFKPGSWFGDNVEIVTFALDRPGARIAAVNALLRAALPKPDGTGDWFDCVSGSVDNSGMDGSYDKAIEPTMISARWLSVSDHGNDYCGGPHPESFITSRNFDLVRGIEIDPLDWFGPKAVHREDLGGTYGIYKTLTPAFRAMILKGWKGEKDADCDDAMRNQEDWTVGIARGALVFTPRFAHVIMACTEDFKIPFARLRPWLNDQGNAALPTLPS